MSVKVANSRFINSSLQKSAGFYQQLFREISGFHELGQSLVRQAEVAQSLRQVDRVEEIALVLSNLPLKEHRLIGNYYQAWLQRREYNARQVFESVLEQSKTYKAKALISLAASESYTGNYETELSYFTQALKVTDNPSLIVESSRAIAVVKAKEGNHDKAIKDLERMYPLVKHSAPNFYYQYLNSFSVELAEVGRIEEAANISRIVLASPFVFAYPEWRETGAEIALRGYKSRSSVPVIQSFLAPKKAQNVLRLPERERPESTRRSPFFQPSNVTSLEDWKNKMVKEPNGENGDEINIDEMSDKDILFEIMNLTSEDDITREQLKEILDAVRKITSKKP